MILLHAGGQGSLTLRPLVPLPHPPPCEEEEDIDCSRLFRDVKVRLGDGAPTTEQDTEQPKTV